MFNYNACVTCLVCKEDDLHLLVFSFHLSIFTPECPKCELFPQTLPSLFTSLYLCQNFGFIYQSAWLALLKTFWTISSGSTLNALKVFWESEDLRESERWTYLGIFQRINVKREILKLGTETERTPRTLGIECKQTKCKVSERKRIRMELKEQPDEPDRCFSQNWQVVHCKVVLRTYPCILHFLLGKYR